MSVERAPVPDGVLPVTPASPSTIASEPRPELGDPAVLAPEQPRHAVDGPADETPHVGTTAPMAQPSAPQTAPTREPLVPSTVPSMAPTSFEVTTAAPTSPTRDAPPLSEARPRPVNPYLNNTPELRARRLARALVSDLVAYNPQKREQGLRDGTLRQLFRDEIRKSWDEYVEQVGANVAESTPHFQDALNDVLAGGRRVF